MTIDLIDWDDENADVCGETYDHEEDLVDESDGMRTYECRRCGAEWWEDEDDD